MLLTLALRHLLVRKVRGLVLLLGFALGVGVMLVLLSVGEAMLAQSRDVSLVGGGEVTVLPQGIDVEAMRTGGVSGLFFGIDRARFVTRQALGGPREAAAVRAVSPVLEEKLLYVAKGAGRAVPVRMGGEIPSRAAAVGAGLDVRAGAWRDVPADSAWIAPTPEQLYHQLDRFHVPARPDSTWAEWHYFKVLVSEEEWWYVTWLVGGALPDGRWGGQLLATHRKPGGGHEQFVANVAPERIVLDTTRADLVLGESTVRQRGGAYDLVARAPGGFALDLRVVPTPERYFPQVELRSEEFLSGYVVPVLAGTASGSVCVAGRCTRLDGAHAYHDHNWGTWREVTWEWGTGQGTTYNLIYGGVRQPADSVAAGAPFFLALVDARGVRQVLRFRTVSYAGARPAERGGDAVRAPERFEIVAARERDTVRLRGTVQDALATRAATSGFARYFLQMRARWTLEGRVAGAAVADSGSGFFETYVAPGAR